MTVLYRDLSLSLEDDESDIPRLVARKLRVLPESVLGFEVVRKSIDARKGRLPRFTYTLAVELVPAEEERLLAKSGARVEPYVPFEVPTTARVSSESGKRPVVIGSGPAGLFAAYRLAQAGRPAIVIERGLAVRERSIQWNAFLKGRQPFDTESNLLYGEGGAGTYSDGKLYSRVNDPRAPEVLRALADCGAPKDILIEAKPHVGSNLLPSIIRRLRDQLIDQGTEFRFSTLMTDLLIEDGRVVGVVTEPGGVIDCSTVFLGLGHSARDTLRMLHGRGVQMERKPFQIGARVEHSQDLVNEMQYGAATGHEKLPPADYRLIQKRKTGDLFSFCMCPGGEILPSTEKPGFICVNGASRFKRIGDFANSGFVVTLEPQEFGAAASDVLAGITLQERIEADAARLASHPFGAPALRLPDFLDRRVSRDLPPTSYPLPLSTAPFEEFLPPLVLDALREGLEGLCQRIPSFRDPEAVIVGPESRSSSPVRILRDEATLESPSASGLYPMGEGAGFAGGILSAAIDGMLCAETHLATLSGRTS